MARSRRQWGSVRSLASGRYQARYIDPDTNRMTPAPQTFATKSRADRWLATKRTELDAGSGVDDKADNQPLREWWPGYWRATQSCRPHTRIGYETAWRLRIEPWFGSMPVRRIKPSHVDDWVADLIEQGLSVSKITESLGVLKRVLDRVVRDLALATNPCSLRAVTLPKRSQMERPVLSPAEVEKLAQAMNHESDRVLVRLLAFGGLRINECFALQWSDVDLERKTPGSPLRSKAASAGCVGNWFPSARRCSRPPALIDEADLIVDGSRGLLEFLRLSPCIRALPTSMGV